MLFEDNFFGEWLLKFWIRPVWFSIRVVLCEQEGTPHLTRHTWFTLKSRILIPSDTDIILYCAFKKCFDLIQKLRSYNIKKQNKLPLIHISQFLWTEDLFQFSAPHFMTASYFLEMRKLICMLLHLIRWFRNPLRTDGFPAWVFCSESFVKPRFAARKHRKFPAQNLVPQVCNS